MKTSLITRRQQRERRPVCFSITRKGRGDKSPLYPIDDRGDEQEKLLSQEAGLVEETPFGLLLVLAAIAGVTFTLVMTAVIVSLQGMK